jgi:hypothetical protein
LSGNCAGFSSLSGEDLLLMTIPTGAAVPRTGELTLETCECSYRPYSRLASDRSGSDLPKRVC